MDKTKEIYLGKHLLVGLTYLNEDESVREKIQLHGTIVAVSDNTIRFVRADNGEKFSIPFDEDNILEAETGAVYKLKSTGEHVVHVDYLSHWIIHPPE